MKAFMRAFAFFFVLLVSSGVPPLWADWPTDGVPVCTAELDQMHQRLATDGAGGAIITWFDCRQNWDRDIYVQRVDASGAVQWTPDGVALCTLEAEQTYPDIIPDGAGGAIIAWQDSRYFGYAYVRVQRVDASGVAQWTPDGVQVCTSASGQLYPKLVSDGAGGAVITWYDGRALNWDVYAQRVNSSGVVQWAADGVPIATGSANQLDPRIISDGAGGAIITW